MVSLRIKLKGNKKILLVLKGWGKLLYKRDFGCLRKQGSSRHCKAGTIDGHGILSTVLPGVMQLSDSEAQDEGFSRKGKEYATIHRWEHAGIKRKLYTRNIVRSTSIQ